MKILFLASDIHTIGGIQKYNRDFLSALLLTNAETMLVERKDGGLYAKLSFVFRSLVRFFRERPDVILCSHLNFAFLCLILKKLFGVPYVLALYGVEVLDVRKATERLGIRGAERVITISDYIRGFIERQFPGLKHDIFMLPSAVDGTLFTIQEKNRELLARWGIAGKKIAITLSRLVSDKHKGQDRVLQALPSVLARVPDAVYVVVGGGKDVRVEAFMKEHPELAPHVIFTGPVPDEERLDYYNLGDVFILPSKYEGFAIVFIESLACGVPVIASDGYGCREGLLNGNIGLLVSPDDIQAIADALVSMLTRQASPLLFDRERLREKTLAVYGIDAWNARVKQLVSELSLGKN